MRVLYSVEVLVRLYVHTLWVTMPVLAFADLGLQTAATLTTPSCAGVIGTEAAPVPVAELLPGLQANKPAWKCSASEQPSSEHEATRAAAAADDADRGCVDQDVAEQTPHLGRRSGEA